VANWPTSRGVTSVLDVGANIICDAERLVEFAIMGAAFHRAVHKTPRPTLGLLNVGVETEKGHEDVRGADRLLREHAFDLDYRGFVEGDDIARGAVDVIVTDGFTGNVALKTAEGLARFFRTELRTDRATVSEANERAAGSRIDQWRSVPGAERDRGQKPWRRRRPGLRQRHPPGGRPGP
jgi:fatty acid/phospholipid biosynthesis enzyme